MTTASGLTSGAPQYGGGGGPPPPGGRARPCRRARWTGTVPAPGARPRVLHEGQEFGEVEAALAAGAAEGGQPVGVRVAAQRALADVQQQGRLRQGDLGIEQTVQDLLPAALQAGPARRARRGGAYLLRRRAAGRAPFRYPGPRPRRRGRIRSARRGVWG